MYVHPKKKPTLYFNISEIFIPPFFCGHVWDEQRESIFGAASVNDTSGALTLEDGLTQQQAMQRFR